MRDTLQQTYSSLGQFEDLSEFEEVILLLVTMLNEEAYAFKIAEEFEKYVKKPISLAIVRSTLGRLENKRVLVSELKKASAERGGNRKRIFSISGQDNRGSDLYSHDILIELISGFRYR